MKVKIGMCVLVLLMVNGSASAINGDATTLTGNELLQWCKAGLRIIDGVDSGSPGFGVGYCLGSVSSTMDILYGVGSKLPVNQRSCFPAQGISYAQDIRVVVKFLEDNPNILHFRASDLMITAFGGAYPCK